MGSLTHGHLRLICRPAEFVIDSRAEDAPAVYPNVFQDDAIEAANQEYAVSPLGIGRNADVAHHDISHWRGEQAVVGWAEI